MNLIHRNIPWGSVLSGLLIWGILCTSCKSPHLTQHSPAIVTYPPIGYAAVTDTAGSAIQADSLFLEAERQKMQGNFSDAAKLFKNFLDIRPDNATAAYELALLNGRSKNAPATLQYARQAALLDTTNHWYRIAYANALAMNQEFDSAAFIFHQLALRYPRQDQYRYNEAVMLSSAEKYTEALYLFKSLEKEEGINEEFVYQKQRIFLKMGKPDSAAAEIQKLIDLYPDNSRYYGLLAQVYADNNQPGEAIRVYQTLLKKYPNNPQAMVALGVYYKNKGDDSAYRHYMKKAFSNPRFDLEDKIAFVYPYLKYVEIDSGKKQEALFLSNLIAKAHPDDSRAHTLNGEMLFQCKEPDSAAEEFRQAIAIDSSQFEPWNQLMLVYATTGNDDSLFSTGQLATNLFPDEGGAWYFFGMANFFTGQYQSGINALEQALALGVNDKELKSRIYSTMGEAYFALKNNAQSDSCFALSLQLNPKDPVTLNNYSYQLAERGERLEQALTMIQAAIALQPGMDVYEDTYAWVLFRLGRYKEAKHWMEKVMSHPGASDRLGYLEHYGDILLKNREVKNAVQYWQRAKEQGGNPALLNWKIRHKKLPGKKVLERLSNH